MVEVYESTALSPDHSDCDRYAHHRMYGQILKVAVLPPVRSSS